MAIKANRGRILVEMLGRFDDYKNPLGLTIIDQKRHWQGQSRRAKVVSVGAGVRDVRVEDVVVFRADAGFSMDGDPEVDRPEFGEGFRWLKPDEVFAVEEREEVPA